MGRSKVNNLCRSLAGSKCMIQKHVDYHHVEHKLRIAKICTLLGGGGGTGATSRGLQTYKGPHVAFIFMIFTCMGCFFTLLYLSLSQHCLDSMSECFGRIISIASTVSVDKLFEAYKHVEPKPLIN